MLHVSSVRAKDWQHPTPDRIPLVHLILLLLALTPRDQYYRALNTLSEIEHTLGLNTLSDRALNTWDLEPHSRVDCLGGTQQHPGGLG